MAITRKNGILLEGTESGFLYYPARFNGSTYLTRGSDLTGAADSKEFSLSVWLKSNEAGTLRTIISNGTRFYIYGFTAERIYIEGSNAAGTRILYANSPTNTFTTGAWVHLLLSSNLATGALHLYINGVSQLETTTNTNDTIDFTTGEFQIGAFSSSGSNYFNGSMSELWFDDSYIDFSDLANREKFALSGHPINLGLNGNLPTGSQPLVYMRSQHPTWITNIGSGGGFIENGALGDGGLDKP